ncbi:hypothetical protein Trydic_g10795 [Trypoxylus dichotomus]
MSTGLWKFPSGSRDFQNAKPPLKMNLTLLRMIEGKLNLIHITVHQILTGVLRTTTGYDLLANTAKDESTHIFTYTLPAELTALYEFPRQSTEPHLKRQGIIECRLSSFEGRKYEKPGVPQDQISCGFTSYGSPSALIVVRQHSEAPLARLATRNGAQQLFINDHLLNGYNVGSSSREVKQVMVLIYFMPTF